MGHATHPCAAARIAVKFANNSTNRSGIVASLKLFCKIKEVANSRVVERVAPQASLAPAQAPLAWGALSERLVPPFLQSVSLSYKGCVVTAPVPPKFMQRVLFKHCDYKPDPHPPLSQKTFRKTAIKEEPAKIDSYPAIQHSIGGTRGEKNTKNSRSN